jgi:hypothetical protein
MGGNEAVSISGGGNSSRSIIPYALSVTFRILFSGHPSNPWIDSQS